MKPGICVICFCIGSWLYLNSCWPTAYEDPASLPWSIHKQDSIIVQKLLDINVIPDINVFKVASRSRPVEGDSVYRVGGIGFSRLELETFTLISDIETMDSLKSFIIVNSRLKSLKITDSIHLRPTRNVSYYNIPGFAIDLSDNALTEIPMDILKIIPAGGEKIILSIGDNQITTLPAGIENTGRFFFYNLWGNKLCNVSDSFLRSFYIDHQWPGADTVSIDTLRSDFVSTQICD